MLPNLKPEDETSVKTLDVTVPAIGLAPMTCELRERTPHRRRGEPRYAYDFHATLGRDTDRARLMLSRLLGKVIFRWSVGRNARGSTCLAEGSRQCDFGWCREGDFV